MQVVAPLKKLIGKLQNAVTDLDPYNYFKS